MRALAPVWLILTLSTITRAQIPYTIFTGPGAGNIVSSPDNVNAFGPNTFGVLGSGPHCPPAGLVYGDVTLAQTTVHFHGVLNGAPDPDEIHCGWGHAAPGDYRGLLTPAVTGRTVRTFVLPHILDTAGSIANTTFTFDTSIFATYANENANAPIGAVAINTYLFDDATGLPLAGANGTPVAAPAIFTVGSGSIPRKRELNLDQQITANGGFGGAAKVGYGILVVGGDADNLALQGFVTNSKTSAFDLSVFGFSPVEITAPAPAPAGGPLGAPPGQVMLRVNNIKETIGSTDALGGVSDTLLKGVYVAGLVGGGAPSFIDVALSLFKNDGTPMTGASGPLAPVHFLLDANNRTFATTAEEILQAAGDLAGPVEGYAIAQVLGDVGNFVLAGYHIQTNTGPNDLVHFDQTLAVQVVPEPAALPLLALFLSRRRRAR